MQRKEFTGFEKCKSSDMVTINVKVVGSKSKYMGLCRVSG
jgi:hypothetical protein